MEEYFQISDKTRTLEHQYTDLLTRKLRLETLMVEEDYNSLVASHEELVTRTRASEDSYIRQIDDLKAMIDQLSCDGSKKEDEIRRLVEENEALTSTVQRLERKDKEKSAEEANRNRNKSLEGPGEDGVWEAAGLRKMDEMHRIIRSVEDELRGNLSRLQEDCIRYKGDAERMRLEIEKLELKNAANVEKIREIKEDRAGLEDEVKRLGLENARLARENICSEELRRSISEKDEIISALKENMRQKSEMIEIQRKMIEDASRENGIVLNDDVCNVFDEDVLKAEESGDELDLGDGYGGKEQLWDGMAVKPRPVQKRASSASTRKKTGVPKRERSRKAPSKAAIDKSNNRTGIDDKMVSRPMENREVPTTAEASKRPFIPGSLLKPENSSYFADLTFNNSSPMIQKSHLNLPKKK
ncbi:hypothetical protein J0A71_04g08130 [Encephalitozoon cuniculi]|nr:hypothetical protein J0A71_04g08130 [Encephalitozoon cuniculi]